MIHFNNPTHATQLRDVLTENGYTEQAIMTRLELERLDAHGFRENIYAMQRTREMTPIDLLIRLVFFGKPVPTDDAARMLTTELVSAGVEAGLFTEQNGQVHCEVSLVPHAGLLLVAEASSDQRRDRVMTLGTSSVTLAGLTVRRPSRLTLDLGCGSGILALLAARHSDRVIGIDYNARAIDMARLGAQLNGLSNAEFLVGDWMEPVQGLKFDLIVANPPYVISPENQFIFRDNSDGGDGLCRRLTRTIPEYLNEGGFLHMMIEWLVLEGQEWRDRVAGWVEGTGCDAWLLKHDMMSPPRYALFWTGDIPDNDVEERFLAWMRNIESFGACAVGEGVLTMRKRSGSANWFRSEEAPSAYAFPAGDSILTGFLLRDYLDSIHNNDEALLSERLRLSPDARLNQTYAQSGSRMDAVRSELTLTRGIPYQANIDPMALGLIARCDGTVTVRELLTKMAEAAGTKAENIIPPALALLRNMIGQGFLLPESAGKPASAAKA